MSEEVFFDKPLEWRLNGTPDMVAAILANLTREVQHAGNEIHATQTELGAGGRRVRLEISEGAVGFVLLHDLPGQSCRLQVPIHGGLEQGWGPADAEYLSAFMARAREELERLGLLKTVTEFGSQKVLETARREIGAAEESEAIASTGTILKAALLALADELFEPYMLMDGGEAPKKDDAKGKLRLVIKHYLGGRSENFRDGVFLSVRGAWDASSALPHRQRTATSKEAAICLALVTAVFEAFSLMVPEG